MPKKLVRRGRVEGYRPTRERLVKVLQLAQKDIDKDSIAKLLYSQGSEEIYSQGVDGKILPENLDQVISDAGDPNELNNLYFSINQDSPVRRVEIEVGPGNWTRYLIESDDQTWAHGRYHEITEEVLADRSLYAKGHSPAPQVPKEGADNWRSAAWELKRNRLATALDRFPRVLALAVYGEAALIIILEFYYHNIDHNPKRVALSDRHNADLYLKWFGHNINALFLANISYIGIILLLNHWMKSFLKSKVLLQEDGRLFLSQLGFRKNRNDTVATLTVYLIYLTFGILLVSIMTVLI